MRIEEKIKRWFPKDTVAFYQEPDPVVVVVSRNFEGLSPEVRERIVLAMAENPSGVQVRAWTPEEIKTR